MHKILFIINVDWFFLSHRLPIALAAKNMGLEVHIATNITNCLEELKSHGFIIHSLKLEREGINLKNAIITIFDILKILKKIKPDLVHLVTIKPVLIGGIAARMAGVPSTVAAIAGLGSIFVASGFQANLRRFLVAVLYKFALSHKNLKVIFQNSEDKLTLMKITGLAESKTFMIHGSGVDLNKYSFHPISSDQRIVLFPSRLLIDKGLMDFVEAARILRTKNTNINSNIRFVIVGEPDPANPTSVSNNQLKAWVAEGVVEYWGYCANMPEILSSASIVTLPSYYGEGLPKVLIEAAACGRVVVTTDHPGCRDAIEAGVSGVLVPIKDAKSLSDAIQNLLDNPERCDLMGRAGRELAERSFDVNQVVAAHLRIYDQLMTKAVR